jgi:predicted nucleic acid-binding protein
MGLIVVDTSVLIDNLRDDPKAVTALDRARDAGDQLFASVVTKAELLIGMRRERPAALALLDALDWVAVSEEIAELAGTTARRYRASHQGIGLADYLIGATAQHLGGDLWTRNPRNFPMFPGLRPPY